MVIGLQLLSLERSPSFDPEFDHEGHGERCTNLKMVVRLELLTRNRLKPLSWQSGCNFRRYSVYLLLFDLEAEGVAEGKKGHDFLIQEVKLLLQANFERNGCPTPNRFCGGGNFFTDMLLRCTLSR